MSKAVYYYVKMANERNTIGRYRFIYMFHNLYGYYWEKGKYFPTLEMCKHAMDNFIEKG